MSKLWQGRFQTQNDPTMEEFTSSISFDNELYKEDIMGSIAHAKMLGKCAVISEEESQHICTGLINVFSKIQSKEYSFSDADEDIHMNIERLLSKEIGPLAGKLHTGRSRNDQVATDLHLYLRNKVLEISKKLCEVQKAVLFQIEKYGHNVMPGYTHLQRAQPILYGHHLLAYMNMFQRDFDRLSQSWGRINQMPLGAGALAGTKHPIDREYTKTLLGFDSLYENSMDAVSDRDFICEFLFHSSQIMIHLSRMSEELILWSSQEFAFIDLADPFCSGSSMMPQKKNPDVPELIRGKTGRVFGSLFSMMTIMKGLPLTYNRDLQEDKEPLFDTVKTVSRVLDILTPLLLTLTVRSENMLIAAEEGFMNATDLADYLVSKNMPFREAHSVAGKLVRFCIDNKLRLNSLTLEQYQEFSSLFDIEVFSAIELKEVVASKKSKGGTSFEELQRQILLAKQWILKNQEWLTNQLQKLPCAHS